MPWFLAASALLIFQLLPPIDVTAQAATPVPACNYSGQALHTMSYPDLRCLALTETVAGLTLVTDPTIGEWIAFNPDTLDSNATW